MSFSRVLTPLVTSAVHGWMHAVRASARQAHNSSSRRHLIRLNPATERIPLPRLTLARRGVKPGLAALCPVLAGIADHVALGVVQPRRRGCFECRVDLLLWQEQAGFVTRAAVFEGSEAVPGAAAQAAGNAAGRGRACIAHSPAAGCRAGPDPSPRARTRGPAWEGRGWGESSRRQQVRRRAWQRSSSPCKCTVASHSAAVLARMFSFE